MFYKRWWFSLVMIVGYFEWIYSLINVQVFLWFFFPMYPVIYSDPSPSCSGRSWMVELMVLRILLSSSISYAFNALSGESGITSTPVNRVTDIKSSFTISCCSIRHIMSPNLVFWFVSRLDRSISIVGDFLIIIILILCRQFNGDGWSFTPPFCHYWEKSFLIYLDSTLK